MSAKAGLTWIGALAFVLCVPGGCRDDGGSAPGVMLAGETRLGSWRCRRYAEQRVVRVGETVKRKGRGAEVKLLEVSAGNDAGFFQVDDQGRTYRGWVRVGQTFEELTPAFGRAGAALVKTDQDRATVLFQCTLFPYTTLFRSGKSVV